MKLDKKEGGDERSFFTWKMEMRMEKEEWEQRNSSGPWEGNKNQSVHGAKRKKVMGKSNKRLVQTFSGLIIDFVSRGRNWKFVLRADPWFGSIHKWWVRAKVFCSNQIKAIAHRTMSCWWKEEEQEQRCDWRCETLSQTYRIQIWRGTFKYLTVKTWYSLNRSYFWIRSFQLKMPNLFLSISLAWFSLQTGTSTGNISAVERTFNDENDKRREREREVMSACSLEVRRHR